MVPPNWSELISCPASFFVKLGISKGCGKLRAHAAHSGSSIWLAKVAEAIMMWSLLDLKHVPKLIMIYFSDILPFLSYFRTQIDLQVKRLSLSEVICYNPEFPLLFFRFFSVLTCFCSINLSRAKRELSGLNRQTSPLLKLLCLRRVALTATQTAKHTGTSYTITSDGHFLLMNLFCIVKLEWLLIL